jgi:hypothetical protein
VFVLNRLQLATATGNWQLATLIEGLLVEEVELL